jgi:hypothetical protein
MGSEAVKALSDFCEQELVPVNAVWKHLSSEARCTIIDFLLLFDSYVDSVMDHLQAREAVVERVMLVPAVAADMRIKGDKKWVAQRIQGHLNLHRHYMRAASAPAEEVM